MWISSVPAVSEKLRARTRRAGFGDRRGVMIEHLQGREKSLEPFGWRGREAEWIALVCLHSGVFTRAQFCYFFDALSDRKRAFRFVRDLVDRGLAVEDPLANKRGGAKACRISNKEIYRKLGIENVRHRREVDDSLMLRRLALARLRSGTPGASLASH